MNVSSPAVVAPPTIESKNMTTALTKTTEEKALVRKPKALEVLAGRLNVDPTKLYNTLKNTVFKGATDDEMLGLVVVANRYNLDPMLRQIFAFPKKGGGIVPMVPIDGWAAIVNSQPDFDGCDFEFTWQDEKKRIPDSCTCSIFIKNRSHPMKVTEYYAECYRDTDPWNKMPTRMLRHKALMQCARYAFSVGGIVDEDEAKDIINVETTVVPAPEFLGPPTTSPAASEDAPGSEPAEKPVRGPKTPPKPSQTPNKATPEPEPEPEPVETVGAAENAQSDAPEEEAVPANLPWAKAVEFIGTLLEKHDLSEDQLLVYCKEQKIANSKQSSIKELSATKLNEQIIAKWAEVWPKVAEIQI